MPSSGALRGGRGLLTPVRCVRKLSPGPRTGLRFSAIHSEGHPATPLNGLSRHAVASDGVVYLGHTRTGGALYIERSLRARIESCPSECSTSWRMGRIMSDEHREARQEVGGHEALRPTIQIPPARGGNYRLHFRSYPGGLRGSPNQSFLTFTGRPVRYDDAKGREGALVSWWRGAVDASP